MYIVFIILSVLFRIGNCASYQRYDDSTSGYPAYTSSNGYNQYQKHLNYEDLASMPEGSRYPNYNLQSSTSRYNSMGNSPVSDNSYYQNGYNTPRYAAGYGQRYGQGYEQSPGQNFGQGLSSYELPFVRNNRDYCINRVPQTGIWVDSLMGIWYGVELVQHLAGDSRVDYGRTCIVIHISEPKDELITNRQLHHVEALNARFRQRYRHLRLLWDEEGQTIEYSLYFTNDSAGYWQAFEGQNGTMSQLNTYKQFSGVVQVLKAVNDHLVLNFCQEATNGKSAELYSVLFSRDPRGMTRWEVESVHSLLQNKNLSVASRRMVCGNGAGRPFNSFMLSFLTCLFAYIVCSS